MEEKCDRGFFPLIWDSSFENPRRQGCLFSIFWNSDAMWTSERHLNLLQAKLHVVELKLYLMIKSYQKGDIQLSQQVIVRIGKISANYCCQKV